jgi:endonuclease/exonuclease/phosphatase family metal-dependent hydrolase
MKSYKIISCNVRTQVQNDGVNQFVNRVDFLCEKLGSLDADVIGFQEVTEVMRKEIIARMPTYAFFGAGRRADRLSEAALIAVKQSRLIVERVFSEILSNEPHIPGSTYGGDQSSCPRIFSSADLMPIVGGKPFRIMNIHTDHIGKNATVLECDQMIKSYFDQQKLRPMPTVLTGDYNATPEAPEIRLIIEKGGFTDITESLPPTFHDFGRCATDWKIDYIFTSPEWKVDGIFSYRDTRGELYLSDHDPVMAVLQLED